MQTATKTIMALDIGERRIGVALANSEARLASPFTTLETSSAADNLAELVKQHNVAAIVVGLPRSLVGQDTAQTHLTRGFIKELKVLNLPIHEQDEAVTSRQAEAELKARGRKYNKGDIDALAATFILEDYLRDNPRPTHE